MGAWFGVRGEIADRDHRSRLYGGGCVERYSAARQVVGLVAWLAVCFAAAAIGAAASASAPAFYRELDLPAWAPPASWFGPVWTLLYALMGVSAWLVWRERGWPGVRAALAVFLVQLAANALWSWLFFAWRQGLLAFVEILVLFVLIVATIGLFWRVSRLAAALLLPYLAWVGFASALTLAIWRRNPELLG
jgi:benzodiazapine receptor